jgi:hypothetical protein
MSFGTVRCEKRDLAVAVAAAVTTCPAAPATGSARWS